MGDAAPRRRRSVGGAVAVGTGILLSRVAGLVRERAMAYYLGNAPAAGALRAALRIPNLLQNLLGEGVLSASFVPVYARLLAEGRVDDARRVARVVGTLLAMVASLAAVVGIAFAGPLVDALAPGFEGPVRALTVDLVRILFPGTALLVMSAWCLGVLSGHRRFFMSYAAPVLWNVAIIAAAVAAGAAAVGKPDVATWLAWGALVGSGLQLAVQLPSVVWLLGGARPTLAVRDDGVRATLRAFGPVLLGRGSVQVSSYLDQVLASYLGPVMVAAMGYAQILFLLPISLFGMAISAAELPEMASITGGADAIAVGLRQRLASSLRRVTFLVVPSAVALATIGGPIVALLFQTGAFGARDTEVVWLLLAGSALGLLPSTLGRLLASAFYALGDARPPLHAALIRVVITFVTGWAAVLPLREQLGYSPAWGAFGLMLSWGIAAWIEFALLRRWLAAKIGAVPVPWRLAVGTSGAAALAGGAGAGAALVATNLGGPAWLPAAVAVPSFGVVYLGLSLLGGVDEARALWRRVRRRA
ncbi:MAG: murein biosynthesis integral membrane protein MurJ [Kofleriaceae bacterium]